MNTWKILAAGFLFPLFAHGQALPIGTTALAATARRPAVPLLIGNENCPLLCVTIEVGKPPGWLWERNDARLASITFHIIDGLDDLESVRLLASGDDDQFRTRGRPNVASRDRAATVLRRLGPAKDPQTALTFAADVPLHGGKNVFWLCARLKPTASLYHSLAASCASIETNAGRIVPADLSPGLLQRAGIALRRPHDDGVDTYAIPALATSAQGSLLCVYDMRWNAPGHDLQDHITTGLSRSTDGGKTWEPMRTIMDMSSYGGLPPEQNGCSDPGIVVDRQTGEIFAFSCWMHGNPHHHQWLKTGAAPGYELGVSPQFIMVRSGDDGRTWSRPDNITRAVKQPGWWLLVPCPTSGIQLRDGTLVLPVEGRYQYQEYFSGIIVSRDHGAHWTMETPVPCVGANECQVAQLEDGSLMLNARDEEPTDHRRAVFVTRDLGHTWTAHGTNLNTLIEPRGGCNGSLLAIDADEGGRSRQILLFTNPHSSTVRVNQMIQVSFDQGQTWPRDHDVLLDEGRQWGYPCLTRIDRDHVGVAYAGSQADVIFQAFTLAELLR